MKYHQLNVAVSEVEAVFGSVTERKGKSSGSQITPSVSAPQLLRKLISVCDNVDMPGCVASGSSDLT